MTESIKRTLKDSALLRWFVVLLVSGLTFGTYWFQDFFSGIKPLMESQMGITSSEFGDIIQWTTWANVFGMIIIGGIILDKWGIRISGLIFGSVATIGAALTALGAAGVLSTDHGTQLWIMMIGRLLFGVGLEIVCVIVTRTIVKWFKGYEIALAMAINMGFGRLGSTLGTALSPDIASNYVPAAVNFAATLIGIGLIMFIVYLIFDIKIDKQVKAKGDSPDEEKFKFSDLLKLATDKSFILIALLCVAFYSAVFPFMQYAPDFLINTFGFTYDLPESSTLRNAFIFVGLFLFGIGFTLIPTNLKEKRNKILSLVIILGLFVIFIYNFRETLSLWLRNGPKTASLIPLGTILFTPIFGTVVDKKGKAASLMIIGSLLLIFSHLSFSIINNVNICYLGLLSLGVAFSLVPAAMWPSVARIVPEHRLGTAYAAMFTVQNWGLNAFFKGIGWVVDKANPKIVAQIQDIRAGFEAQGLSTGVISEKILAMKKAGEIPPYDYTVPILLLVGCGVISIFLAFWLKKSSKQQGYGLELPSSEKE
jgi:MFS family permease